MTDHHPSQPRVIVTGSSGLTLPRMVSALLDDPASWYRLHEMTPPSSIEARAHALAGERR